MAQLLSSFEKRGIRLGLDTIKANIEDNTYLSKYFAIVEYNPTFTAGKNLFSFNGTSLLAKNSEIKVECLDSYGNPLYIEFYKSIVQNTDITKFVISINVYNEVYNGPGKLILVGTSVSGEVVRWIGNIAIDKTLNNISSVRFYDTPTLEVRPLLYPVVDVEKAQIVDPAPPASKTALAAANISKYINNITVNNGGSGYTKLPIIKFNINNGDAAPSIAAQATAIISGGSIVEVIITDPGLGYSNPPTIQVIPNSSDTITEIASCVATLSGRVTRIDILDAGGGYNTTTPPKITITPNGSGQGADAVAVVDTLGQISEIQIISNGDGYVTIPNVTFAAPVSNKPILTIDIHHSEDFYSYAVVPGKDFNKTAFDNKRFNTDYRVVTPNIESRFNDIQLIQTGSFNTQMEGKPIVLNISKITIPKTYQELDVNITQSFIIKKVLNPTTVTLTEPFYYQIGKDYLITNIISGKCEVDYSYTKYNTAREANKKTNPLDGSTAQAILQSYAEITYRNIRPFSGYVARHKLYCKSLSYPGDYKMISDEPLSTIELLTDIITVNKAYDKIGQFYNQSSINKYWYSTAGLSLTANINPINSLYIYGGSPSQVNGTQYVIAKTDSVRIDDNTDIITNDNVYYPYDKTSFDNLSGRSYNSNFIPLKKNVLYVLSFNVSFEKEITSDANLSFYFTSSVSSISKEVSYNPSYGMKLGSISTNDTVSIKNFDGKQFIYFTPTDDYYGTLVLVPYKCNVKLSELSLKVYGDYGFSPDILFIRIPFPVHNAKEAFEIKSELFDINSKLIYSDLKTVQIFDIDGISDSVIDAANYSDVMQVFNYSTSPDNASSGLELVINPTSTISLPGNVVINELIPTQDKPQRFVGWFAPSDDPTTSGKLCYTNVSQLFISDNDYISLSTIDGGVETTAKALSIKYVGKRIFIDTAGNKYHYI